MDQSDGRLPLYQRLRDDIARRIARNEWRPGFAIPTEAELAHAHGVAVGTVRKALDALVADGLIERHQGRGTFVRRPNFDSALFRFFRHQRPGDARAKPEGRILDRRVQHPPPPIRARLRLEPGEQTLLLSRLRLVAGAPILSEQIWLPLRRFTRLLEADLADIGDLLYPAYERLCGEIVARAEEQLTIGTATTDDVRLLGVTMDAPVVVIERLAFDYEGKPLEWRLSRGAATGFAYRVDIR